MNKNKTNSIKDFPSAEQLESEIRRIVYKNQYAKVLRSTVYALITVAAAAVLVATLFMPVLQIYGSSMAPTINEGEIVVSLKGPSFRQGDIVAFYYNNTILLKRLIAMPGDWVDIDESGNVFVNGEKIEEPYIAEKALGETNIELPYQVPENRYFVMGDHRATSVDSRNTAVGCVAEEQIVGRIIFRIWPLSSFGKVD